MDGATGEQRHPMEEACGVSVFPTGRNRASGKHPGPTETVSTASLFPTAADDKLFGITRGARTCLRPWRPDFLSARGKNWPLCPWQAVFHVARGCRALICPWQASPHNSGAVEPVFVSAAVRGGAGEGSAAAGVVGTAPVPAQREARMEAEPGPPRAANETNEANDPDRQGRFSHLFHLFSESCYPAIPTRKSLRKSPIVHIFVNQLNLDP